MTDKDTYHTRTIADAQPGGRFASVERSTVTAAGPIYPRLPASSPWSHDPVPPEEPLGIDINEMPALGGMSACVASPAQAQPDRSGGKSGPPSPVRQPIRRLK